MGYVLLAPILAPLAQDPCLPVEANVFRDPHVSFAFGGTADFHGRHKVIYNFLSTPDFAVNVKTEEAVFRLHNGALTVNGSFLTEAHIITRFAHQRSAFASFWASELDVQNFGWQVVNGSCAGRPFKFGNRGSKTLRYAQHLEIRAWAELVEVDFSSLVVTGGLQYGVTIGVNGALPKLETFKVSEDFVLARKEIQFSGVSKLTCAANAGLSKMLSECKSRSPDTWNSCTVSGAPGDC